MEHWIQTLLTMTATAAVAAAAVMILRLLLKKAPRWITCCLWLVVFLRMVCPTGLSLPVSLVPQGVSGGAYVAQVLPDTTQAAPEEPLPLSSDDSAQAAPASAQATPAAQTAPAVPGNTPAWPRVLMGLWGLGVAATLLWAALSYGRLRRRIADAVRIEGNLYETDRIDTPFVCGFFRPCIYLPVGLDATDRQYVLLHERAHIRRRDHLVKPLFYLALCVHWFNPVLWLAYRLLCRDIETACDQAVIRSLDKPGTAQYAAALLHLGRKPSLPNAVPLAFGEEDAKGRIRSVLSYKKPALWLVLVAAVACLAAGVLLLGNSNQQMEGHKIASSVFLSSGDSASLPQDLQRELLALCTQYEGDKTEAPDLDPFSHFPRVILSTDPERATVYTYDLLEDNDQLYLVATEQKNSHTQSTQTYSMPEAFSTAYQAWQEKLEDYLWVTRPDELFSNRGYEIQNEDDVSALLALLDFPVTSGGYEAQLDQSTKPYSLTITLERPPVLEQDTAQLLSYLRSCATVFFSLTEDVDTISWASRDAAHLRNYGVNAMMTGPGLDDPETFRAAYQQMKAAAASYTLSTRKSASSTRQVLYLSPQLAQRVTEITVANAHYEISSSRFAPTPAMGTGTENDYPTPYYQALDPANEVLSAYGVDSSQHTGQASCTAILNVYTQDTGYRIYEWDGDVFLAHFDLTDGKETLEYLVQLDT